MVSRTQLPVVQVKSPKSESESMAGSTAPLAIVVEIEVAPEPVTSPDKVMVSLPVK